MYEASNTRIGQLALSYGADIADKLTTSRRKSRPRTTHLVAAKWGTVKVHRAVKFLERYAQRHPNELPPLHIVTPEWLYACAERWEKVCIGFIR